MTTHRTIARAQRTTMAPVMRSPLAGRPAPKEMLVDPARLEREYYARKPDIGDPDPRVVFGTSGQDLIMGSSA